uniref:beta-ketoacyl-ACP synthase III n=1 Tax=Turicimonas muris TaxID=1796652 RepID=UPI00402AA955
MEQTVFSRILSTGSALPKQCVSNKELAERLNAEGVETSDEWIKTRTGIEQRYLVSEGETTVTLAVEAAKSALSKTNLSPEDIDLIIVATTTPDNIFPSCACQVQAALGCTNAAAFDLQAVCSGFAYSLCTADSMIKSGNFKKVLVIGSESLSRILDWQDRTTCVLFGDGAGAVILEASSEPGILSYTMKADGALGEKVLRADGRIENGKLVGNPYIFMNGKAVFKAAVEKMTESGREVLEKVGLKPADVSLFVPHQANLRIMSMVTDKLGINSENMMVSVNSHGNTSAASIPLALDKAASSGRIKRGDILLLQGVGGGFTWASVLLKY